MNMLKIYVLFLLMTFSAITHSEEINNKSIHGGFVHPSGVDIIGYSVEKNIHSHLYYFYTFGIPSFAAIGVNYYQAYEDFGFIATFGIGLGFVMYGSIGYQFPLLKSNYLKLGAMYATGVALTGTLPVAAYEYRF